MALVTYPDLPQCEGTARSEVTEILSDVSESGVVRGRCMYTSPTYELTVVHSGLSKFNYDVFNDWWKTNLGNEILFTWVVDGLTYQGFAKNSPTLNYVDLRYDVSLVLLVKEA